MSDEPLACPDCGAEIGSKGDLEPGETVRELTFEEPSSAGDRPRVVLGAGQRNLWLCKNCGKVLGVG
ncbi:hypothetical protein [Halegenticoccus soli]|uniref:hypothetical protein n=1 Tax=Halegenticoccus soli TaxID=1985678 RepID=UPI000C6CD7B5|nr:hypothetical protein [Halegenticoccus soli]